MDASHVYVGTWALCCFHRLISTQTFRRTLTASVDSCAEIKSAPSTVYNQFWQSLEEGVGKRCSECELTDVVGKVDDRQHDGDLQGGIVEDTAEPNDSQNASQNAEHWCERRLHPEGRDQLRCHALGWFNAEFSPEG